MSTDRQKVWRSVMGKASRDEALAVRCPRCGMQPHFRCIGQRMEIRYRKAPHAERFAAYLERQP